MPHGAVISDGLACVVGPEENWVYACADCHPDPVDNLVFVCIEGCHDDAHLDGDGGQLYTEDLCTGCHVSAGPDNDGLACDSLP